MPKLIPNLIIFHDIKLFLDLFCYLIHSFFSVTCHSVIFQKTSYHLCNFRTEFTNLSSFFPDNLVTVFYSVFYTYMLRRGGLREKNKPKRKPKHSWVNVADIFENYCAVILLLFSNGMVQKMLAFMYLLKKKPKKTGLDWPHSPLAHGLYHLTSDVFLISARKHENRFEKKWQEMRKRWKHYSTQIPP